MRDSRVRATSSSSSKTTTSTSGRHFVQGVDVWLNNPRRPLEASGTSGQKVVLNGGLNLSVLDGWWAEAYDGLNGFAIGTGRTHSNMDVHDTRDGEDLVPRAARRSDPALLPARPRRTAARLDQAHEAHHSHAGLALQRGSHGDGLHAEVLRSGGRRHVERYVPKRVAAGAKLVLRVECVAVDVDPGARIQRLGTGAKGQFHTAPLIAKKGSHHSVRHLRVIIKPGRQIVHQFDSRRGVSFFDSEDELAHSPACRIVRLFMPAYGAVSGRAHQPFLVCKVPNDGRGQTLCRLLNLQQRAPAAEDILDMANRLKDLLVFVIDFRDKHRM